MEPLPHADLYTKTNVETAAVENDKVQAVIPTAFQTKVQSFQSKKKTKVQPFRAVPDDNTERPSNRTESPLPSHVRLRSTPSTTPVSSATALTPALPGFTESG